MRNKLIAAGLGLVGYGALLGWAVTGDKLEAKMKSNQRMLGEIITRQAQELEAAKTLFLKQTATEEAPAVTEEVVVEAVQEADVETMRIDEQLKGETPEETRANLQRLINRYHPEDEEAFVHMATRVVDDAAVENSAPEVISQQTYAWDEIGENHAKVTATYYPNDRVMLDDDGDPVDEKDIDGIYGWKNLQRFGDQTDNPDTVFIRNFRLETDFEVFRDTENQLPAHVKYGIGRHEFETQQAAGITRFRRDDV